MVKGQTEKAYRVGDGRRSRLNSVSVDALPESEDHPVLIRIGTPAGFVWLLPYEARHVRNRLNALLSQIARQEGGER